jgi:hypothetical protein
MNTVSIPIRTELPICMGKDWDRNAVECAGGPDPSYDDKRGGHIRQQCNYYQMCTARTQANKQQQQALLSRPPLVTPPPAAAPKTFEGYLASQVEQQRQAATAWRPPTVLPTLAPTPQPTYPQYYPQPAHPQTMQQYYPQQLGPQFPAAQYQLNYQVPGYLTVPEERADGEGLMSVLFREMCRGTGKAAGQVLAHFFDVRTFRGK